MKNHKCTCCPLFATYVHFLYIFHNSSRRLNFAVNNFRDIWHGLYFLDEKCYILRGSYFVEKAKIREISEIQCTRKLMHLRYMMDYS